MVLSTSIADLAIPIVIRASFVVSTIHYVCRKKDPKMMNCPKCGDEGRIGNYRPKKAKQSHKWDYYIAHEQIEGFWDMITEYWILKR